MKTILQRALITFVMLTGLIGASQAQVQIISPNGGEEWLNATYEDVVWENQGDFDYFLLEYSPDNGVTWYVYAYLDGVPGTNTESFYISLSPTNTAKMRVSNYDNPQISDESDQAFSIVNAPYTIYYPYPGYTYYQNTDIFVYWATDTTRTTTLEFSPDNGETWEVIASGISENSYTFTAPEINSFECLIKVSDTDDPNIFGVSELFNVLVYPQVTVVSPNGGEVWEYGSPYSVNTITWTGINLSYYVNIEFSADGGQSWQLVATSYTNADGGNAQIQTPFTETDQARIRISDPNFFGSGDISDANFSIEILPFSLFSPTDDYTYYAGQPIDFTWSAAVPTEVNIEVSTDNGLNFQTVASNIPSTQTYYTLNAPSVPTETCIYKLVESNDPSSFILSETLQIVEPPVMTLVGPTGGEIWDNDSIQLISWTYEGNLPEYAYIGIDFSADNGLTWNNIALLYYYENENTYQWKTPLETSDSCLIRVYDYFYPFISATSPNMFSIKDLPAVDICMVSVDPESGNNLIVWNDQDNELISEYVILKETNVADEYIEVGTISSDLVTTFIDTESNPAEKATRYKLAYRDASGNRYGAGSFHQTIHLSISKGVGNTWNLSWNSYLGFPVNSYNVYRGSNENNMELLGTVSGNFTSFTDLNAQSEFVYYMIEVINPNNCNPTGDREGSYGSSTSNIATNNILGINEKLQTVSIAAYPNPVSDRLTVKVGKEMKGDVKIQLISTLGTVAISTVTTGENLLYGYEIMVDKLSPGIYTLHLTGAEQTGSIRFIKSDE